MVIGVLSGSRINGNIASRIIHHISHPLRNANPGFKIADPPACGNLIQIIPLTSGEHEPERARILILGNIGCRFLLVNNLGNRPRNRLILTGWDEAGGGFHLPASRGCQHVNLTHLYYITVALCVPDIVKSNIQNFAVIVSQTVCRDNTVRIYGKVGTNRLPAAADTKGQLCGIGSAPKEREPGETGIIPLRVAHLKSRLNGRMSTLGNLNTSQMVGNCFGHRRRS